jgi:hypothetical protein
VPKSRLITKTGFSKQSWTVTEQSRSLILPAKLGSGHAIGSHSNRSFQLFRDAAEELTLRSTILDGEIVALDGEGIPRFQVLQKWQKRPTAPVAYVLFDLLWDSGRDLTGNNAVKRRKRLQEIVTPVAGIQVGGYLEKRGVELFRLAKESSQELWSAIARRISRRQASLFWAFWKWI